MGDPRNENTAVTRRCQSLVCDGAARAMSKAPERFSFRFKGQAAPKNVTRGLKYSHTI